MLNTKEICFLGIFIYLFFQINTLFGQNLPPAPTGLRVTATECGKISLAWDDYPSGVEETKFAIYRNELNSSSNKIVELNANVLTYTDESIFLSAGRSYEYKIVGIVNGQETNFSQTIIGIFQCPIPTGLEITNTQCGQVSLKWNDISGPLNETAYDVYRADTENGYYNRIAYLAANVLQYSDESQYLIADKTYYYKVSGRFTNNHIFGELSSAVTGSFTCPSPPELILQNASCGEVKLIWQDYPNNISENGYQLLRSNSVNGPYFEFRSVSANITSFIDDGTYSPMIANVDYFYKIQGKFFGSYTLPSNVVNAKFTCPIPNNLQVESANCGEIKLKWDDITGNLNETKFEIYSSKQIDGQYSQIASLNQNVLNFTDIGSNREFSSGSTYYYKVRAKFSNYYSEFSNSTSASFTCLTPTGLNASSNNCHDTVLTWDPINSNTTNPVTKYLILKANGYDFNNFYLADQVLGNVNTYTDTNPNRVDSTYKYKIIAVYGFASSQPSDVVSIKFNCLAPTNFRVSTTSCGKINLAWDDYPATISEYGYAIFRSETGENGSYTRIGRVNANILTFLDDRLVSGHTYFYKLRGEYKFDHFSRLSNPINASILCPTVQNFRVISTDCGNINFAWDDVPAEFNEDGFEIYKIIQRTPYSTTFKLGTIGQNITNFSDIGFTYETGGISSTNVEYKYFIRAKFGNSYSVSSQIVSGSFTCPTPPNPTYVSSSCGNIKISWPDFPSNYSESGFEIYRASAANGYYAKVGQVTANILEYDDINNTSISNERFFEGKDYFYKIKGLFNNNTTELSTGYTQGSFDCLPPQNLRVTNNSYTGVSLAWDAGNPPSSLQAYWIERAENLEFENFEHVGSVNGNTYTFTNNDYFEDGKKYYYRVQWLSNKSVFSDYSNIVEVTYSSGPKFPGVTIQNFQIVSADCSGVSLSWDDLNANLNEASYSIYRSSRSYYSDNLEIRKVADLPANTTSYFDIGSPPNNVLLFGQPLEYYIVANMANSLNKIESTHQSTTINCGNDIILTTSQSQNCDPIVLNWTDLGPNFEETKFTIYRKNEADENYRWIAEVNANTFTYTDNYSEYIKSGENIKYKIISVKNYIESKASNELSVVPICPVTYNLTANATCNGIELNWDDLPSGTAENGFRIYRSVNNVESEFEYIDYVQANTLYYLDSKETFDKKTYYYKIAAVKSNFLMGFSNTVSAQINCFQAPAITVSNIACGKISLAWTNNNPNEPSSFQLFRSTDGQNGEYKLVFPKTYPSYQNNTHVDAAGDLVPYGYDNNGPLWLASNTDYFYKVVQQIGNVFIESNIIAGQFFCPSVPTGLKVASINCNSVDLSWNPSDGHGKNSSGYTVFRSDNGINGDYKKQYNFSNYLGNTTYKDYPDLNYSELVPGKTYYYKIRFYLDFISSQFTAPIEVKLGTNMFTTQTGLWTDPATWSCGRVPTSLDEILINNGHKVTIGENLIGNAKNITNNGELEFGTNSTIILHQ